MITENSINIRDIKFRIVDLDGNLLALTALHSKQAAFGWVRFGSNLTFKDIPSAWNTIHAFPDLVDAGALVVRQKGGRLEPVDEAV